MKREFSKIYDNVMKSKESNQLDSIGKLALLLTTAGLDIMCNLPKVKWFAINDDDKSNILDKSRIVDNNV